MNLGTSRTCISPSYASWQKPRFLPAETKPMSEKAPQATFSNELGNGLHLLYILVQAFEQDAGQVPFTGVRQNHDDRLARLRRVTRHPQTRYHRRTAGYAVGYACLAR